jgi:hypothetical protein
MSLSGPPPNVHDQEEQRWLGEPPPLQLEGGQKKKKAGLQSSQTHRSVDTTSGGGGGAAAAALAAMGKPSGGGMAGVAAGMTTLKAVTKLKRAITPYYLQYNPKFETTNAKEMRQELRTHPQVVGAIDRIWTSITGYGKFLMYTGFIEKEPYVLLSIQVQKAVMEPDVFDEDVARKTAEDEWDSDSVEINGVKRIDHSAFHNALFELADIWTPEISPDTYSAFLWKLTQRITTLRVVVYDGLYDNKTFDNTQFFDLKHNKPSSKIWASVREKHHQQPIEVYYMMKQTVADVDSMQDPDAEVAFTDPHLCVRPSVHPSFDLVRALCLAARTLKLSSISLLLRQLLSLSFWKASRERALLHLLTCLLTTKHRISVAAVTRKLRSVWRICASRCMRMPLDLGGSTRPTLSSTSFLRCSTRPRGRSTPYRYRLHSGFHSQRQITKRRRLRRARRRVSPCGNRKHLRSRTRLRCSDWKRRRRRGVVAPTLGLRYLVAWE